MIFEIWEFRHYQNGDSQREIAAKTLLPRTTVQYMIEK